MNKFLSYAHQSIDSSDIESVSQALKGDMITRDSRVEEFEKTLATYCGAQYKADVEHVVKALKEC